MGDRDRHRPARMVAISRHGFVPDPALETITYSLCVHRGFRFGRPREYPGNLSAAALEMWFGLERGIAISMLPKGFCLKEDPVPRRERSSSMRTSWNERSTRPMVPGRLFQNEATPTASSGASFEWTSGPLHRPPQAGICKIESDGDQAAFSDETGGDPPRWPRPLLPNCRRCDGHPGCKTSAVRQRETRICLLFVAGPSFSVSVDATTAQ